MIPINNGDLYKEFIFAELPSTTFKMHLEEEVIAGFVDELEAVKQAIYLILNVERYRHLIYSWNYGAELGDLIGRPTSFCLPEIKRRIAEALLQDRRITEVDNFLFDVKKGRVHATFTVSTIFGKVQTERIVEI